MITISLKTSAVQMIALVGAVALISGVPTAQTPNIPSPKPTLRRDRTQRILYPKIIQCEDERTVTEELKDMRMASHGGVRRRAILALGRIGYASGVTPVIEILADDHDPELRALAAFAAGEIESQYAVPALLDRLDPAKETSLMVRARAAEALGKIASNELSAASLGQYGIRLITEGLTKLLPDPAQSFSDEQRLVATLTLTALLRLKQPSTLPAIIALLRSPDSEVRWQAANTLARIRDGISPAVPMLLGLLSDKDPLVRATAARALGAARDKQAVDALVKSVADPDERVVANAINALGTLADARCVDALVGLGDHLLAGSRSFDREKNGVPTQQNLLLLIASALGNIRDPRGLPLVKAFRLADGGPGSSPEAEIATARFGEAAFFDFPQTGSIPKDNWKAIAAYAQGLGQLGTERAKTVLLELLSGKSLGKPDPRALPDILNALSASKAPGLREILLEHIKLPDVIVRATSANLLGTLNDQSSIVTDALEAAYKAARTDKTNDARVAILEAADRLKHPMNLQALSDVTRDDDYVVRLKAVELLRKSDTDVQVPIGRLQIGKVNTGHDRTYWRRMAQLMTLPKNPVAVIHTRKGEVRIELLVSDAPLTVDNFIQLSKSGFYNGLTFIRVVPNFVIQGGDPRGDSNGGPGYQIRDEINLRPYRVGTVGMALSGKDTGGSQFFITHSPQPHLDGGYTVFGQVVSGMDTVNRIARGDRIERIEIIGVP